MEGIFMVLKRVGREVVLRKGGEVVKESFRGEGLEVVPFRRGQATWSVEWK